MTTGGGYRGYIGSRPYFGQRVAQHIQNIVIRDFCSRRGFTYLLSATEYAMEDCFLMLDAVVEEPNIEGIVLFSMLMLPPDAARRDALVRKAMARGLSLHGAAENVSIATREDYLRAEETWLLQSALAP